MTTPQVLVHSTADDLAEAVCARLLTTFVDIQATGRVPSWVLTGGSIADRIHAAVAASKARDEVDWARVELWWGDERFLPSQDADRNETQARKVLLDRLPLDPPLVHPMAASDEVDGDLDAAAEHYSEALRGAGNHEESGTPAFDVAMLGVGPDGHVASLFPGRSELHEKRPAVAVRDSPKPPPTRITLTLAALQRARQVWFVVAGDDKADAVQRALTGADVIQVPAAGPRGTERTLWLLDGAAASALQ
ncbi:MAG: 6-phosphogluconolactonase [Nocardioidaceae bacterium]